ncbi:putative ATPase/DNA-binding SARP family transcriptional activator [Saccharothrix tamanrassetensis]|uniref:Putative ATPase/DNA-binding SARP family transcriptional activator n=1 Tax=Saccharothrix tamanrassetensis TaxID=1051531 RepID=A0A841CG43_9PSEU|nr:BTAD domain-containing putative transcriptional regulator [Saccharothrix tamanrassetensis]MBB5957492.1 putative ATPase/DNA-binding SARP family transcriptional activator [Saccharothrix tamanrassetensis]
MRVEVLGPVRVFGDDGAPVELAGARLRMLLGRLALSAGEAVSSDALIEDIWGTGSSAGTANTLHALVHRLRRALPDAGVVESPAVGYRLALPADGVDAHRFEVLAARGRRELAAGEPGRAAATLGDALALWHGSAFEDVLAAPYAGTAGVRLEELRAAARESRFEAELRLGRHAEVLPDVEAACAANPLRERLAALRMRALCAAGRQSDALAVYEDVRARLADELGVDPSAELRQTHVAVLRGELDRPVAAPARSAPGRLPSRLTSFVGRADELELLAELLKTSRLVTVVGPGGVGKTRLAVEAASRHPARRDGRLWLVPLAGVESPQGVAGAILGALGAGAGQPAGPVPADPLDRVAELLGGDEAVLVLDNCEHVVAEVARTARRLLEARPQLTVLATSRESLEVMGEASARLGPLDVPPEGADPVDAAESTAVRLFLDRAAAVRPGFTLDESTAEPVVDVVRRLDGLPLAVELAAARLRSMGIGQIARRLDDRFRLLSTGNRAAQPRQRTLRAVIGWSWELLTDRERVLARRLAIFPATTAVDAVEAVCADGRLLVSEDVFYVLGSLVDKSLVEQRGDGYRMLESIRAFAIDELSRAGEREAVRDRFTRHFAALAAEHEQSVRSHDQPSSLVLLAAEYDNLVFALRSAIDGGDPSAAVRLLGLLHWYWYVVRYDARAESFTAEALAFGDALPRDARAAFTAIDALIGESAPTTDPERVRVLIADCSAGGALERYPLLLMVTLPIAHQLGLGELVDAEIRRVRSRPDSWARACMALLEGVIARDGGDWEAMTTAPGRAAREFADTGDRLWTAVSLAVRAGVHSVRGDHHAAVADLERGIALTAGAGSQDEVSFLVALATVRMRAGDLDDARRDVDAAERLARERGGRYTEQVEVLRGRAELHRRSGHPDRSERALDRLAELARRSRSADLEGSLAPARMALRLTTGDAARARELLPAAIRAARTDGDPASAAQQLAHLLFLEADLSGAATALGMSQAIRGAFDDGDPELRELAAELTRRLGRRGYDAAYRAGVRQARPDAIARLDALATRPHTPTSAG